ncbi:hypothetical protein EVC30_064 [Rhizobium phage RHph_Y1_11]|nr:hypothetical protein EVC30_064 [Rhizobium phage RHph_Y1_11]
MDNFAWEEMGHLPAEPELPKYERVTLERRLTHKYVGTYKHLDSHEYVGDALIRCRDEELVDDEDPCEPTTITMVVEVVTEQPQPLNIICEAIRDTFSSHGCAHEWDCCGCWSTWTSEVAHAVNNKFLVELRSHRNY